MKAFTRMKAFKRMKKCGEAVKYGAPLFLPFVQNVCGNNSDQNYFVIHLHSLGLSGYALVFQHSSRDRTNVNE